MKIFDKDNKVINEIEVDDSSVRYRAIMTDDSLTLNFSLTGSVNIPRYSYVDFEGARYTLWRPQEFKKHNTRNHEYTLVLHGYREYLKFVKYKDMSAKPYRLKFSLTAKPIVFLQNLVACLNEKSGGGWTVGDCIDAPEKTLSFNHEFCIDAIGRFAQEWDTEFEFESRKVHLRKIEKFKDVPLPLSYGKGNGFLPGVGRYNDGDKQPVGRVYVQGGERNIDFSKYGSKTLLLPKSATLTLDGKTYRTDADGMYIIRDGNNNEAEDSYDGSSIYPHRVGTVSEVVVVDANKGFYDIKDSSIPENLNYRDCRIGGEKAIIKFESGALAGREFDIEQTDKDLTGYIHAERRFKIVPAELDGVVMPGGAFVPVVGDKYAIFNVNLPQAYISDDATKTGASWEMFREAARYFAENENDRFKFTGELDGVWSKSKWLEIGGKIVPGGHVLFSDEQFQPAGVNIRIVAVKDYVNKPHKPEITLSNAPISGSFGGAFGKLEADEVVIENSKKEVLQFSKRQWRDARETMQLLAATVEGFSAGINPVSVQTMGILLGDESLQFRFVNSKTAPVVVAHNVVFNKVNKVLNVDNGILQHMTLGIDEVSYQHAPSKYKYWDMAAYTSPPLSDKSAFFLYAKCSKTSQAGIFVLSKTAIKMEAVDGFYHFFIGILNSEIDGGRSYNEFYGYSEMTPGRLTIKKIVSPDGKMYINLETREIVGNIRFLSGGSETDLSTWAQGTSQDVQNAQAAANEADRKARQAILDASNAVTDYNAKFAAQQAQIDGVVDNWFYDYSPTLSNYPASSWTTDVEKDRHVGDTFTNTAQVPATDAGKSWRFVKNGSVYLWTQIADSDAVLALQKAAQAQATADGKSSTFLIQPTSYHLGDTWVLNADRTFNGIAYKSGEILTATQDSTTFVEAHWIKRVRYTDDSAVENLQIGVENYYNSTKVIAANKEIPPYENITNRIVKTETGFNFTGVPDASSIVRVGDVINSNGWWVVSCEVQSNYVNFGFDLDICDLGETSFTTAAEAMSWKKIELAVNVTNYGDGSIYTFIDFSKILYIYFNVRNLKVQKGNKASDNNINSEDLKNKIADAKLAGTNAQNAANSANSAIGDLNNYVDNAFKDGIIDTSEAKAIEKYINIVNSEKAGLEATYNKLYTNSYLEGTPKTNLLNAKVSYFGAVDNLLNAINSAIADGKTTVSEKQVVDARYNDYKSALSSLQSAIEDANKAIQEKLDSISTDKVNAIEIGGVNTFKSTTPIAGYLGIPPYTNLPTTRTPSGFDFMGRPEGVSNVRIGGVITSNGWWTVSFDMQSNGTNYPIDVDICDLGTQTFYTHETAYQKKRVELSAYVIYHESYPTIYNFVDIGRIPYIYLIVSNLKIEKGNKATSYTEAPEDVQARIDTEKNRINEIFSDNIADPAEKKHLKTLWDEIYTEYPRLWTQATDYAIDRAAYETAYSNISSILAPILADLNVSTNADGATIRARFSQYYDARTVLINAVTNKVNDKAVSAANAAQEQAYLKEVLRKSTEIQGGLILAGTLAVRDAANKVRAYVNGLASKVYAFAAGVTNFASTDPANPEKQKTWIDHFGNARIGNLRIGVDGDGSTWIEDSNGVTRVEFSVKDIPALQSLLSASEINRSATNTSRNFSTNQETFTFPNSIEVVRDGSELTIEGSCSVTARATAQGAWCISRMTVELVSASGEYYAVLGEAYAAASGPNSGGTPGNPIPPSDDFEGDPFGNATEQINKKLVNVPAGFYKIKATYYNVSANGGFGSGSISQTTMRSKYRVDNRQILIGKDGISAFFNANKYVHIKDSADGTPVLEVGGGIRVKGNIDIGGVLASASVNRYGGRTNVWGAKSGSTDVERVSDSGGTVYRVRHEVGHSEYTPLVSPLGWYYEGRYVAIQEAIINQTPSYFDVIFTDYGGTRRGDVGFNYMIVGKNYA